MSFGSIVVLAVVAVLFVLAVRSAVNGKTSDCPGCGADCGSGSCATCSVTEKLLSDIEQADKTAKHVELHSNSGARS